MFSSELKESNKNSSAGSCGCSNRLEDFPDGYFSRVSSTFSTVVSVLVTCFDVGFGKSECLNVEWAKTSFKYESSNYQKRSKFPFSNTS